MPTLQLKRFDLDHEATGVAAEERGHNAEHGVTEAADVQDVVPRGKRPILFNVPHVNERMFPPATAREIHVKRDYHNPRLKAFCDRQGIPIADICSLLRDEHFGDELHPNDRGAKIIAEAVFQLLPKE